MALQFSDTVRNASRATWGPLLAAGAVIAEYQPTMYHCKVMIVDGLWSSVGSTNFDNRSFAINFEITVWMTESQTVAAVEAMLLRILEQQQPQRQQHRHQEEGGAEAREDRAVVAALDGDPIPPGWHAWPESELRSLLRDAETLRSIPVPRATN